MNKTDWKNIFILLPISIFAFFSTIWVRPADLMEARNFITAREMIENNNFVIPTLNGFLRFEKPPLPTWLTAGMMKLTGNLTDEYILRIPSAIIGILFVMLLYCFVKYMTNNSLKSFITAFIGTTTFMIIKIADENSWDIYSYVFSFGAVVFLVIGLKKEKIKDFIIAGLFMAASILSKGPVAIYGMILPFFIAYAAVFGFSDYKKNIKKIILSFVVGVVVSGIWPLAMYLKYPEIFLNVMKKEEATWSTRHTESFVYYLDYFVYMGTWVFFSVAVLFRKWIKKRTEDKDYFKFIFIWNILVILFLSFVQMKKKRYGLPIYMTSVMAVGVICSYYYNKLWYELKKSDRILLNIQGAFITFISFAIPIIIFIKGYMKNNISLGYMAFIIFAFGLFGYVTIKLILNKNSNTIKFLIFGSGMFMLLVNSTTNWFFDRSLIKKTNEFITYKKIKLVRENPPAFDIYSKDYEIEDVWRVGKNIKDYTEETKLPDKIIFFGEIPSEVSDEYKIYKKEIYVKDDGDLAELNYLKKVKA